MRADLLLLPLLLFATEAMAQIDYFSKEIDFWNEKATKEEKGEESPAPTGGDAKTVSENAPSTKFDWKPYLDPKTTEFFKEGEYTPPAPFMEIVRNPSDENLRHWFAYIDQRNTLARRLQERMNDFLANRGLTVPAEVKDTYRQRVSSLPSDMEDQKRYRFRLYFDSGCPHCKRMFSTLAELQRRGFLVEARQIDRASVRDLPVATTLATPEEVKKQNIQSVPYLLIGDLKAQTVYTLTGYQSVESVFQAIRQRRSM